MILAVDIGNTHIVLGCIDGDKIVSTDRLETDLNKTSGEYAVIINGILGFNKIDVAAFEGAIISSVVPPITSSIAEAVKKVTGVDALVVGTGIKTGINILIDNPAQAGADLVVGAVAGIAKYKTPLLIIDMGTATTITAVTGKADFIGGAIIPGLAVSINALAGNTSQLPKISIEAPKKCISTNTVDCMKSGAVYGSASMLDGMIDRMEEELGEKATVVATGGLVNQILPYCRHEIFYDPDLLLRGLAIIYEKNQICGGKKNGNR